MFPCGLHSLHPLLVSVNYVEHLFTRLIYGAHYVGEWTPLLLALVESWGSNYRGVFRFSINLLALSLGPTAPNIVITTTLFGLPFHMASKKSSL